MKQRFLRILYEMRRRYNSPLNYLGGKFWLCTRWGLCAAFDISQDSIGIWLQEPEHSLFWAMMNEEGAKNGASPDWRATYWWKEGKLGPRKKTINAVIERIEKLSKYEKEKSN